MNRINQSKVKQTIKEAFYSADVSGNGIPLHIFRKTPKSLTFKIGKNEILLKKLNLKIETCTALRLQGKEMITIRTGRFFSPGTLLKPFQSLALCIH